MSKSDIKLRTEWVISLPARIDLLPVTGYCKLQHVQLPQQQQQQHQHMMKQYNFNSRYTQLTDIYIDNICVRNK